VLPFIFTVNLFKTNFNELWLYWEIFMIFILILYVPNWFVALADLIIGIALATAYYAIFPNSTPLELNFNKTSYFIVTVSTAIFGFISSHISRLAYVNLEKYKQYLQLTSLAGSIVHEIRNPLNAINLIGVSLKDLPHNISKDDRKKLTNLTSSLFDSVKQANEIINIVLSDLRNKPIDTADFSYLDACQSLSEIIAKFNRSIGVEKNRIKLAIKEQENFKFKAIYERFTFIIYNLLKNALYYLKEYPNSIITIGTEN